MVDVSRSLMMNETIAAAQTSVVYGERSGLSGMVGLTVQFNFTYDADGTDITAHLQTSFDDGATWCDIMAFNATTTSARRIFICRSSPNEPDADITAATVASEIVEITPTTATLADNASIHNVFGDRIRLILTTTGTYSGTTTLRVDAHPKLA